MIGHESSGGTEPGADEANPPTPRSIEHGHDPNRPAPHHRSAGTRSSRPPARTRRGQDRPLPSPSVPPSATARHPARPPRLERGVAHPSVPRHTDGAHEQDQPAETPHRRSATSMTNPHQVVVIQKDGQQPSTQTAPASITCTSASPTTRGAR